MKRRINNFTWAGIAVLFIIFLFITRHLLHLSLSNLTLFTNYKSSMENSLLTITEMMEEPMSGLSIGKTIYRSFVMDGVLV